MSSSEFEIAHVPSPPDFRVLDAARSVANEIYAAMQNARAPWPDGEQLREAVGSIASNIGEGYGRREGAERNQFLRYARGSAEETNERLRLVHVAGCISPGQFWRLHNRLIAIVRMLTSLMEHGTAKSAKQKAPEGSKLEYGEDRTM